MYFFRCKKPPPIIGEGGNKNLPNNDLLNITYFTVTQQRNKVIRKRMSNLSLIHIIGKFQDLLLCVKFIKQGKRRLRHSKRATTILGCLHVSF